MGLGSIPGQGTKFPQAAQSSSKKKNKKQKPVALTCAVCYVAVDRLGLEFCEFGFGLEDCDLRPKAGPWESVGQKFTVDARPHLASPLHSHSRSGGLIYYLTLICHVG